MDDDTDSYRLAVSPPLPDDGLTSEGKPRAIRYKKQILNEINQELQLEEHKLNVEEIIDIYQTDPEFGLTFVQAKAILDRDGPNIIEVDVQQNMLFLKQLFGGVSAILWIGVFLSITSYLIQNESSNEINSNGLSLAIILILILITVAIMGYIEEKKAISFFSSFKKNSISTCTVIRDGQRLTVDTTELAAGDLVEIKVGDRIPADLRLIRTNALKIDSSEFTGESYPMSKNPEYSNENPLEAKNLCFYNTLVTEGMGLGVVIATGERTVISRLKNLAKSLNKREISTPLEISIFVRNCAIHSSIFALFVFVIALLMDYSWSESFILFIGIVAAIMPNSLLMITNVALNLTVRRMARKYCLVKNFKSVETLGNSTVLICDKTGTLTQNRLTVNHYWVNNEIYPADNTEDQVLNQQLLHLNSFLALSLASILCNSAEFENGQSEVPILKRKTLNSNSIETAVLKCMELAFGNVVEKRKLHTKVLEMPFNPLLKIHVTIHSMNYDFLTADNPKYSNCYNVRKSKYLVVVKGAPEKVVERCTSAFVNGKEIPITDEFRLEFNKAYLHFGSLGERVIGFADLALSKEKYPTNFKFDSNSLNFPLVGLRFLGLVSMIDPPRSSVADSILKLRSAGIKVVVATGDHPTTAKAIARLTNIISENNETIEEAARRLALPIQQIDPLLAQVTIVHGTDMQQYTQEILDSLTSSNQELIFARLTPQQKLQIVESFQRIGAIVATVGDGANDIPMIKKSDVSICLGANDVLKEQADLFILDHNFSTIVTCIVEGRWCKVNLKKTIAYLLSSNCPQLVAFICCFLFGIPLPFAVIGIFCIDLITNIVPAISLAFEDPECGLQTKEDKSNNESNLENKKNKNIMKYNVFSAKTIDDGYQELLSAGPNDSTPIINNKLILYSYLQIGFIQSIAGLFAYFVIMAENGFHLSSLLYLRQEWDSMAINDIKDAVGQEWNYEQRKELEYTSQTGYFFAIIVCQWATLIVCKTKKSSLFKQEMKNKSLNFALVFQTLLVLVLIYGPGMNRMIRFYPLSFSWLFIAIPFALIIFSYEEIRKYIIRKNKNGWVERETLY